MKSWRLFAVAAIVVFLIACATTPFRDVPVEKLSDQQLVDELAAAAEGVGRQLNKADYLLATKPDPLYVLSSSTTTYFGTNNVAASGYVAPAGRYAQYFYASGVGTSAGSAQTRYYYTDVNALAETIHLLGAAIAQGTAEVNRRRGLEVEAEMRRRIEFRRVAAQQPVDQFFAQNQALAQDKALVTAVLAWIPANTSSSPDDQLGRAKAIIESMQRGPGLGGDWYGVFSTRIVMDGRQGVINNFIRLRLKQDGNVITGTGELGTNEQIEVDCRVDGNDIKGSVTNRKAGITVSVAGSKSERDKVILDFMGGKAGVQQSGKVALFR